MMKRPFTTSFMQDLECISHSLQSSGWIDIICGMERVERRFQPGDSVSIIFRNENGRARVKLATQATLLRFEEETASGSLPDYLVNANQARKSPKAVAAEVGIDKHTMGRVYDLLGIPRLPVGEYIRAKWAEPVFRDAIVEANRGHMLQRWQDPAYREYMEGINADPKSVEAKKEAARKEMTRRWHEDPKWRKKMQDAQEHRWSDEAREEMSRDMLTRWADPGYRDPMLALRKGDDFRHRMSENVKARMTDPEYRAQAVAAISDPSVKQRALEASQLIWADLDRRMERLKGAIHTIHGQRRDLSFYALSTWEANFGRILQLLGREYYSREIFLLDITPKFSRLFDSRITISVMGVDFVTADQRGNVILYEIMAHPSKDPMGWAKLEMLRQQYPDLDVRVLTPDVYHRLSKTFAERINSSSTLCGWETNGAEGDNLYTNPQKYAARSV